MSLTCHSIAPFVLAALVAACAPDETAPAGARPVTAGASVVASPVPAAPLPAPPAPTTATEVLTQGRAPFDACYAKARAANAELGRTHVDIVFTRDGGDRLTSVELKYRNRFDDASKDCMRTAAEAITFPATLHGTVTGSLDLAP